MKKKIGSFITDKSFCKNNGCRSAVQKLPKEVDEVVAVLTLQAFHGVGAFYEDFREVGDEEIMSYLDKLRELRKTGNFFKDLRMRFYVINVIKNCDSCH
ncbi:hypothetical protein [Panacibacter ginsenosidivorans]|uniref:hypothetical protein n=1 Tax=Panacibacter ginsenosidivorans TaxID=1813871 RepID=UPI0018650193|nr:hypothetical protein [Panacibacter ginsenosidivorans]